jgi:hypothetical protein
MVRDDRLLEDFIDYNLWQNKDKAGTLHYNGRGKIPGEPVTHLGPNNVDAFIHRSPYRVSFSKSDRWDMEGQAPMVCIDRLSVDPREEVEEMSKELGLKEYKPDTYIVMDGETGVAYLTTGDLPKDTVRIEGTGLPDKDSENFRYSDELEEVITHI